MNEELSTIEVLKLHICCYSDEELEEVINKIKAESWQEGYDEFERAHGMSNYEPWEYAQDNPYEKDTK